MFNRSLSGKWIHGVALQLLALLNACAPLAMAETVYQSREEFLSEAFDGSPPASSTIELNDVLRRDAAKALGHTPFGQRVRYWQAGKRSVWILDEIGKTKPITTGIIVENGQIKDVRILIYRESHGSEVRHDFFTDQFADASLNEQNRLDKSIDGISGATLSVQAIRKLAAFALLLDRARTK